MVYILFIFLLLVFFAIPVFVARKVLADGQEKTLRCGSRVFGILSFIVGSLVLWGLITVVHEGFREATVEGVVWVFLIALGFGILGLMGIELAGIGIYIGGRVKRDYGYSISGIGLFYNVLVCIGLLLDIFTLGTLK